MKIAISSLRRRIDIVESAIPPPENPEGERVDQIAKWLTQQEFHELDSVLKEGEAEVAAWLENRAARAEQRRRIIPRNLWENVRHVIWFYDPPDPETWSMTAEVEEIHRVLTQGWQWRGWRLDLSQLSIRELELIDPHNKSWECRSRGGSGKFGVDLITRTEGQQDLEAFLGRVNLVARASGWDDRGKITEWSAIGRPLTLADLNTA
jgi:hypothetical protein